MFDKIACCGAVCAQLWTKMAESMDADSVYVELAEFVKKLDELKETLIDNEMLLVDQLEVIHFIRST